jgi:hypothetical protein
MRNKTLAQLPTNIAASKIEAYYGNRFRSRMRAMFNLITFDKSAKDKR